jgi:exopolysaccharide production protein ExoZ
MSIAGAPLAGPSVGNPKLRGVEAARGVAAVLVVLRHATDLLASPHDFGVYPLHGLFLFGNAGVDFFFVLSGFIIYHVHQKDIGRPARTTGYAWRRFVRICPTYWVVMAGFGLILLYSPEKNPAVTSTANVIASVFLLPRLQDPILGVAWTLRHELLFYTLFGILVMNRTAGRLVFGAWAALIGCNMLVFTFTGSPFFHGLAGNLFFRGFNAEFFFGIAVARLLRGGQAARWPRIVLLAGTLIFLCNGLVYSFGPRVPSEWPPQQLTFALGAAMILYGLVGAERVGRLRVPRFQFALGTASYSIYLTHLIAIMILQKALPLLRPFLPLGLTAAFVVVVAISVGGGLVFSRLVEVPLLTWLRRRPPRIILAT